MSSYRNSSAIYRMYFDSEFYSRQIDDTGRTKDQLLEHYLSFGWKNKLSPSPYFDTPFYLRQRPNLIVENREPFIHFLAGGWKENLHPHPLINLSYYTRHYDRSNNEDKNPWEYYALFGANLNHCSPHWMFDYDHYRSLLPNSAGNENLFLNYVTSGWKRGLSPSPFFDPNFYLSQFPSNHFQGNPLFHYLEFGYRDNRNPNPFFDVKFFYSQFPSNRSFEQEPIRSYLAGDWRAGKSTSEFLNPNFITGTNFSSILRAQNSVPNNSQDFTQLLFMHIPKTAGSSVGALARKVYADSGFIRVSEDEFIKEPHYQENMKRFIPEIPVIFGHFNYGIHKNCNRKFRYLTFVRNPVDRVISCYVYFTSENNPKPYFSIGGRPANIEYIIESGQDTEFLDGMVRRICGQAYDSRLGDDNLDLALKILERDFSFIGVVEDMENSFRKMAKLLNWPNIEQIVTNVSPNKGKATLLKANRGIKDLILKYNKLDQELYELIIRKKVRLAPLENPPPTNSPSHHGFYYS